MSDSNIPFTVGELWVLDGAGNAPVLLGEWTVSNVTQFKEALTEAPVWSPDGEFLAFSSMVEGGMDIWLYEMRGKQLHRVTHGAYARHPTWLPGE